MKKVTLNEHELTMGASVGIRRNIDCIVEGKEHNPPLRKTPCEKCRDKPSAWHNHVEAGCAEVAAAKVTGRYWAASFNTFKGLPDLGDWEVRWTSKILWEGKFWWAIRKNDHDDAIFIFVSGDAPTYIVWGWLVAGEAKQDKYLRDPGNRGPAWFVSQDMLRPIEDLIE